MFSSFPTAPPFQKPDDFLLGTTHPHKKISLSPSSPANVLIMTSSGGNGESNPSTATEALEFIIPNDFDNPNIVSELNKLIERDPTLGLGGQQQQQQQQLGTLQQFSNLSQHHIQQAQQLQQQQQQQQQLHMAQQLQLQQQLIGMKHEQQQQQQQATVEMKLLDNVGGDGGMNRLI